MQLKVAEKAVEAYAKVASESTTTLSTCTSCASRTVTCATSAACYTTITACTCPSANVRGATAAALPGGEGGRVLDSHQDPPLRGGLRPEQLQGAVPAHLSLPSRAAPAAGAGLRVEKLQDFTLYFTSNDQ